MMSLLEINYLNYEENLELDSWAKAEKVYNCDDFFDLFRRKKFFRRR